MSLVISQATSPSIESVFAYRKYIDEKIPYLNKIDTNVIINIAGTRINDYVETLEMLDSADSNHIGYEINISCPNVKEGGMEFGVSPDMTLKLTQELRARTEKILIMKLSPNVTSIADIGLAAQKGGADAVSAINTVMGMSVDINTKKPRLSTTMGGLSGPCIKPVALANVHKLFNSLDNWAIKNDLNINYFSFSDSIEIIDYPITTLRYDSPLTDFSELFNFIILESFNSLILLYNLFV